jgi:hypothetical protein
MGNIFRSNHNSKIPNATFLIIKNGNLNQVTYIVTAIQQNMGEKYKCKYEVFEPYNNICISNANDIYSLLTLQVHSNKSRSKHRFVVACFYDILKNTVYTSVYDKFNDSFYNSKSKSNSDEPDLINESLQYAINSLKLLNMFSKEKKVCIK